MLKHVAIIPDGNRRWARKHGHEISVGHEKGCDRLIDTTLQASELGIRVITFYVFSTENWSRAKWEVDALLALLVRYLDKETPRMIREGVAFHTIGELSRFPEHVQEAIERCREATKSGKKIDMVLALNYGAKDELARAVKKMMEEGGDEFASYLDTAQWPDPDLLIRTSGEKRLSNYLLYQCSYTELFFTDTLWPDFDKQSFSSAIDDYTKRERRKGE